MMGHGWMDGWMVSVDEWAVEESADRLCARYLH